MTINSVWHKLQTEKTVEIFGRTSAFNQFAHPKTEEAIASIKQQLLLAKPSSRYVVKDLFIARSTMAAQA